MGDRWRRLLSLWMPQCSALGRRCRRSFRRRTPSCTRRSSESPDQSRRCEPTGAPLRWPSLRARPVLPSLAPLSSTSPVRRFLCRSPASFCSRGPSRQNTTATTSLPPRRSFLSQLVASLPALLISLCELLQKLWRKSKMFSPTIHYLQIVVFLTVWFKTNSYDSWTKLLQDRENADYL